MTATHGPLVVAPVTREPADETTPDAALDRVARAAGELREALADAQRLGLPDVEIGVAMVSGSVA